MGRVFEYGRRYSSSLLTLSSGQLYLLDLGIFKQIDDEADDEYQGRVARHTSKQYIKRRTSI